MVKLFPALRDRENPCNFYPLSRVPAFASIAFGNPLARALPIGARKYRFSLLPSVL